MVEIRIGRLDIVGALAILAEARPAFASALAAVKALSITETIELSTMVGPIRVSLSIALSATAEGALELDITRISGNLFGVARKLAGDMIVRKLSGINHVTAAKNRSGNISVIVEGIRFRLVGIVGGTVSLDLAPA